jgi:hypothetical protein
MPDKLAISAILNDPLIASSSQTEAGVILQSGPTRIGELIRKGLLRSYRDGRMRKIFLDSVIAYQASLAAAQKTAGKPADKKRGQR